MLLQSFIVVLLGFTHRLFTSATDLHPYNRKIYYIVHLRTGMLAVSWQGCIPTSGREVHILSTVNGRPLHRDTSIAVHG